ncbi:MAG: type II toxin-antitoxin system ParD family antitoxin [Rhizobium sp.]|nr:type II toxin-antitoxin system ParD family antitoxin [Rhizobium sp.]
MLTGTVFIEKQVSTGRYGSADEVMREALRALEAREAKLSMLISHIEIGRNLHG